MRRLLFYATADSAKELAASCGAPQAKRNGFYFFHNTGGELDQSELRLCSTNQRLRHCGCVALC